MRLIDADNFKGKVIADHCYSGVNKLINIDEVPTAYNIDKVIEQLKLELEEVFEEDIVIEKFGKDTWNRAINKAIEIVKRGGKNDKRKNDTRGYN